MTLTPSDSRRYGWVLHWIDNFDMKQELRALVVALEQMPDPQPFSALPPEAQALVLDVEREHGRRS